MASTPSSNLRLELMTPGEDDDTWGTKANVVFQLLENAITKRQNIALAGTDVTLTTTNFADDQARNLCIALTGVLIANVSVIVPNLSHFYVIDNRTTGAFSVTVKTAAGTGVVVPQNAATICYVNGTDVISLQSAAADAQTLDGLDSSEFARVNLFNQFNKGNAFTFVALADGATIPIDLTIGNNFIVTLGGNRTLQLNSPADGQPFELWVVQDGTGGRTLTFPVNVLFSNGITPALSVTGGSVDVFKFTYNLARNEYRVEATQGGATGGTFNIASGANEADVRIFERVGSPGGAVTVNLTISAGTTLSGSCAETPALDLTGFAPGSTINLINHGFILGKGGNGGDGAGLLDQGAGLSGAFVRGGDAGQGGGNAILGPGAGVTFNLYNADGFTWGGGGGGGGGAVSGPAAGNTSNGGGGGGGAGGGDIGRGSKANNVAYGNDGSRGSTGPNGIPGIGGAGATSGGQGANGGNGGDWGTAGSAGGAATSFVNQLPAGVAGPAGKAIELNGGAVTIVTGAGAPHVKGAVS